MSVKIKGLQQVVKNINKAVGVITEAGVDGVIQAGSLVRREGQIQTPVETGNLVASWYGPTIYKVNNVDRIIALIGLTAFYAPFVHEMVGANFTGPRPESKSPARQKGGKPTAKAKFLEDPLKANATKIIELISLSMSGRLK